jgi:hypothetical protein
MAQVFRDLCREAYRRGGLLALTRTWARVVVDIGVSAGQEHVAELRRHGMSGFFETRGFPAEVAPWARLSIILIAAGLTSSLIIRAVGGSVELATALAAITSLIAGLVMEISTRSRGVVTAAMTLVILAHLAPVWWVQDPGEWLRENPLNGGIVVILSAYVSRGRRVLVVGAAALLAIALLVLSFL